MAGSRSLGDEYGGDAGQGAGAQTGDNTSNEDKVAGLGGTLQRATNEGEEGAVENAIDAAEAVSGPATSKA